MKTPSDERNAEVRLSVYFWCLPYIIATLLLASFVYCQVRLQDPQILEELEQLSRPLLGEPEDGPRPELIKNATEGILAFSFGVCLCFLCGSAFYYFVRQFVSDSSAKSMFPN